MTKQEREEFIERMEEFGDIWEDKDVKRVYGEIELEDALNDRMTNMMQFGYIINSIINS